MKTKVRHCSKCRKDTVHTLVGKDAMCEGLGLIRGFMAIATLGITETIGVDKYYQCQKCGEIDKEL